MRRAYFHAPSPFDKHDMLHYSSRQLMKMLFLSRAALMSDEVTLAARCRARRRYYYMRQPPPTPLRRLTRRRYYASCRRARRHGVELGLDDARADAAARARRSLFLRAGIIRCHAASALPISCAGAISHQDGRYACSRLSRQIERAYYMTRLARRRLLLGRSR